MENHKTSRLINASRSQTFSLLSRFSSAIQSLLSAISGTQKQYMLVRTDCTDRLRENEKQRVLLHLFNYSKQYNHPDLILNESEDRELDYDSLNPSRLFINRSCQGRDAKNKNSL